MKFQVGDCVQFKAPNGSVGRVTEIQAERIYVEWVYGRDITNEVMTGNSVCREGELVEVSLFLYTQYRNKKGFGKPDPKDATIERLDNEVSLIGRELDDAWKATGIAGAVRGMVSLADVCAARRIEREEDRLEIARLKNEIKELRSQWRV